MTRMTRMPSGRGYYPDIMRQRRDPCHPRHPRDKIYSGYDNTPINHHYFPIKGYVSHFLICCKYIPFTVNLVRFGYFY